MKSSGLRTGTKSSVLVLSCLNALPLRAIKGQPWKEKKLINAPRPATAVSPQHFILQAYKAGLWLGAWKCSIRGVAYWATGKTEKATLPLVMPNTHICTHWLTRERFLETSDVYPAACCTLRLYSSEDRGGKLSSSPVPETVLSECHNHWMGARSQSCLLVATAYNLSMRKMTSPTTVW